MANLSITAANVAPVSIIEQFTAPTSEAIAKGACVRLNTTTGYIEGANGTSAAEARCCGIAISTATVAGEPVTVVRKGVLDIGDAASALTYDQDVYLSDTDKTLADAHGTVTLVVGKTVRGLASTTGKKLLRVDL
jgi:hypothetical protein